MNDLLFAGKDFSPFLFTVTDESLVDISRIFGVPPTVIIFDNNLKEDVRKGMVVALRKGGTLKALTPDSMPTGEREEKLKRINCTDRLFPYQMIWEEEPI